MNNSLLSWLNRRLIDHNEPGRKALLKLVLGLFILLALLTRGRFDPSPSNLLMPTGAINDWLGIPGALLSGFLFEVIGRMAYAVPVLIIFFSRSTSGFKPGRILTELLAIFSLCTLVALVLPADLASRFQWVGSWGIVSASVLIDFPGQIYAVAILILFHLFYFKEKKLDLTVFTAIRLVFLVAFVVSRRAQSRLSITVQKSAKYTLINWFSPLVMVLSKTSERTTDFLGQTYLKLREKLSDANLLSRLIALPLVLFNREADHRSAAIDRFAQRREDRREILALVIAEYRKSYYKSDGKAFLKLEEEI